MSGWQMFCVHGVPWPASTREQTPWNFAAGLGSLSCNELSTAVCVLLKLLIGEFGRIL
jgi:hypothetical protein